MKMLKIDEKIRAAIVSELKQAVLFADLNDEQLNDIAGQAEMIQYEPNEAVVRQGDPSDSFFLVVSGEVTVLCEQEGRSTEIARVQPFDTIGELGLLLKEPRSATVIAGPETVLLKFSENFFNEMFASMPEFGLVTCRVLAKRMKNSSGGFLPLSRSEPDSPDPDLASLLPIVFIQRHRVLPLSTEGKILNLGCVEDPTPAVITAVRALLPGMDIRPRAMDVQAFNTAMRSLAGTDVGDVSEKQAEKSARIVGQGADSKSPALDQMLKRMVAEGASDVHLSAGMKPRWRIDGDLMEIRDAGVLASEEVFELLRPVVAERNMTQFKEDNDTDFAYALPGLARFRVNMFRDNRGVGAVLRQIPDKILSIEKLGLPPVIEEMSDYPKGLVLVTGPTGSGKSTTLAAMIDKINRTRKAHIITLEDPVEFVHLSQACLVNQREIGPHTNSFARALRAALREDPDIVLVGEMRDQETVALALETANTGHLVFGTLHTNTAVSTVARVVDMFPGEQQNQVRSVLADVLKGVIAQTLCKRLGGGRIAALEILVTDIGICSMIRDNKTHQMTSAMQIGRARGNRLLNEELARLVQEKIVAPEEAMSKAVDKTDLGDKLKAIGIKKE